jgi:hypothetical protein
LTLVNNPPTNSFSNFFFFSSLSFFLLSALFVLVTEHIEIRARFTLQQRHQVNTPNQKKMRRYNIAPRIFLILLIINSAVAAPLLAQGELQAGVDVAHTGTPGPGDLDAMTTLRKRVKLPLPLPGNKWNALWDKIPSEPENNFLARPQQLSPAMGLPPLAPAVGWTDVGQRLPSIPEEPSESKQPPPKLTSKLAK